MVSTQVEGIVLKSFNYGEHHKILNVLTYHYGLIGIFAQNANRTNNKKSALVQPMTCAHFNLKEPTGTGGGLYFLYQGDVVENYLNIKLDYEAMMHVYVMLEIILKGLKREEVVHYRMIYPWLRDGLSLIESGVSPLLVAVVFQFKMLKCLGIEPYLDGCVVCQSTQHIVMLSCEAGGLVCQRCYHPKETILIDAPLVPLVRALVRVEMSALSEIEVEEDLLAPISDFLMQYYERYAGFYLSTKKMLTQL